MLWCSHSSAFYFPCILHNPLTSLITWSHNASPCHEYFSLWSTIHVLVFRHFYFYFQQWCQVHVGVISVSYGYLSLCVSYFTNVILIMHGKLRKCIILMVIHCPICPAHMEFLLLCFVLVIILCIVPNLSATFYSCAVGHVMQWQYKHLYLCPLFINMYFCDVHSNLQWWRQASFIVLSILYTLTILCRIFR